MFIHNIANVDDCNYLDCDDLPLPDRLIEKDEFFTIYDKQVEVLNNITKFLCKRREDFLQNFKVNELGINPKYINCSNCKDDRINMDCCITRSVMLNNNGIGSWFFPKEGFVQIDTCSVKCKLTKNYDETDVLILRSYVDKKNFRKLDKKFAYVTLETIVTDVLDYRGLEYMKKKVDRIDYIVNHHPFSDIPIYYGDLSQYSPWCPKNTEKDNYYSFENGMNVVKQKNSSVFVASFINTCKRFVRVSFIKELQKHIKIHHYGKCSFNGMKVENKNTNGRNQIKFKIHASKSYKFVLAVENVPSYNHVSEKIRHVLISEYVIPIYLGTPNILDFFPEIFRKYKIFINVLDFKSIKDLANYLQYLNNNDTAFMEYFQWRFEGLSFIEKKEILTNHRFQYDINSQSYWKNASDINTHFYCRLCEHEFYGKRKCIFNNMYSKNSLIGYN